MKATFARGAKARADATKAAEIMVVISFMEYNRKRRRRFRFFGDVFWSEVNRKKLQVWYTRI